MLSMIPVPAWREKYMDLWNIPSGLSGYYFIWRGGSLSKQSKEDKFLGFVDCFFELQGTKSQIKLKQTVL